ncbi:MAG: histidine kinase [Saprospiraceae bacterium]|nr:histidine kinase [Saprospiraceae bacterium]MBL0112967.1 histidine kinase [Saprospiraceae bacterium]
MAHKINIPTIILNLLLIAIFISFAIWFDPGREFVGTNNKINEQYGLLKIVLLLLSVFYLNMYLLVPYVLKRRGWLPYLGAFIIIFILSLIVLRFALAGTMFVVGRPPIPPLIIFLFLLVFSLSLSIGLANFRKKEAQLKKDLEYEASQTELALLRSQISPHFLFNILNTLSSLARQKSDQLESVIINVSQLMRYMLYNKAGKKTSLQLELEYLESFIQLQQLRFGEELPITKKIYVENMEAEIEPMILIPFIENAFKYGMNTIANPEIEIDLSVQSGLLQFLVKNRFNIEFKPSDDSSGIGLENVKKRLLLLYPNRHQLKIQNEKDWFIVDLKIELC